MCMTKLSIMPISLYQLLKLKIKSKIIKTMIIMNTTTTTTNNNDN